MFSRHERRSVDSKRLKYFRLILKKRARTAMTHRRVFQNLGPRVCCDLCDDDFALVACLRELHQLSRSFWPSREGESDPSDRHAPAGDAEGNRGGRREGGGGLREVHVLLSAQIVSFDFANVRCELLRGCSGGVSRSRSTVFFCRILTDEIILDHMKKAPATQMGWL